MRLLISVRSGAEAVAAAAGGADFVDAKDPAGGALGAVAPETLIDIYRVVQGTRPVTAALGDATTEEEIEQLAFASGRAGTAFVKVGFAGISERTRVSALIRAAIRGAQSGSASCGVVAVAYADWNVAKSLPFFDINGIAADAGAAGVLIDTVDKRGPGLPHLINFPTLERWCLEAHAASLFVAAAGRLTSEDCSFVRDAGADIAGFRGAACDGGRTGHISREKVSALREWMASGLSCVDHE